MPTWGQILTELGSTQDVPGLSKTDIVRRKYLTALHEHTGRNTILYATKFTQPSGTPRESVEVTIRDEDLQGLMETLHGLKGPNLDLILHSPGGSAEAAAAFVTYLRSKFKHIRVIVPSLAMSAATMVACAADEIVMGKHSFLGPIDPQIVINAKIGQRMAPAQAILEQFRMAQRECADAGRMAAWIPILDQYGPDLLVQCETASLRAEKVVKEWLRRYMFRGEGKAGAEKADNIAKWLSAHKEHLSHSRHLSRSDLRRRKLKVTSLEKDQIAQDLFLSVFHATTHTFNLTHAVKIIENHKGKAFMRVMQTISVGPMPQQLIPMIQPQLPPIPQAPPAPQGGPPAGEKQTQE